MAKYSILLSNFRFSGAVFSQTCWKTSVVSLSQPRVRCYSKKTPGQIASGTFKFSDLQVSLAGPDQLKPKPDVSSLVFGKCFTDHMLEVEWDKDNGWSRPLISPLHDLPIHPAAKVLHYAVELFDGMKAYRGVDGKIRLFRPDLNAKRILRGAERSMLPAFEPEEFVNSLKRLIRIEEEWIPHSETSSLYIRPTFIGTDPSLGVARSMKALLYTILCPVGPYFETGFKPVSLLADPKYVRAWPGGCGDNKLGSNYAPTVFVQKTAEDAGLQQVLWLYGEDHQITEVGTMNIFAFCKNSNGERELITPPLHGLILPGVTRQSILDMTREWNEFKVTERPITMKELIQLNSEKRLLEFFGAGTACIICPVSGIAYLGEHIHLPTVEHDNPIHLRILKNLSDIYYGRVSHDWAVLVD